MRSINARCPHCTRTNQPLQYVRIAKVGWCCKRCVAAIVFMRLREARRVVQAANGELQRQQWLAEEGDMSLIDRYLFGDAS